MKKYLKRFDKKLSGLNRLKIFLVKYLYILIYSYDNIQNIIREYLTNNQIPKKDTNGDLYKEQIKVPYRWTHGLNRFNTW